MQGKDYNNGVLCYWIKNTKYNINRTKLGHAYDLCMHTAKDFEPFKGTVIPVIRRNYNPKFKMKSMYEKCREVWYENNR